MEQPVSINKDLADATLHSLESLGVEHSVDALSVELEGDDGQPPRRAFFNPATRKWRLSQVSDLPLRSDGYPDRHQNCEVQKFRGPQPPQTHALPDWTSKLPHSDFVEFFKNFDWSSNSLGLLQDWDLSLQQYVHLMLSDSSAAVIYWGRRRISIHNDFMGKLAIDRLHKQTDFMGQTFSQAWPELINSWNPLFDRIQATGLAEDTVNVELYPTRGYGVEETFGDLLMDNRSMFIRSFALCFINSLFFQRHNDQTYPVVKFWCHRVPNWHMTCPVPVPNPLCMLFEMSANKGLQFTGTILPLRDTHGQIQGFYNRAGETTKETLRERRTATLNAVAAPSDLLIGSIWDHVFNAFRDNPRDFPLAFAFSANDDTNAGRCMLQLQASIGVPTSHPCVQQQDLYSGKGGFMPSMRKAKAENKMTILRQADGTLPDELLKGFEWGGFGEPSCVLAIVPITASERLVSVVIIGLNSRRPFDDEYENFMNNLVRQMAATVTSAIDHEESLARELRLQTQLQNSEKQIRNLAEFAPTGMCRIATSGLIMYANDQFYEISGHEKSPEAHYELSFVDIVLEEDQPTSADLWPVLLEQRQKISVALRMKRKWTPPVSPGETPTEEHAWILVLAYPIVEDDEVTSIAGCITDISTFKWAESVQARAAKAAKEAKKLQEDFIDVVSHEMRNPLSAIIQCADGIESSLDDGNGDRRTIESLVDTHKQNIEAAKVILLCAGHQKRIIDDVLTLSKLDSLILSVTPIAVQPTQIMDSILTMFEAEFASHDIEVQNIREPDWYESKIDWAFLDPSRLTQIVINLISNAIKFTSGEPVRQINLRLGATLTRPPSMPEITWFPTIRSHSIPDVTLGTEWGEGEQIYISFAIEDTGKGLEEQEMLKLFNRFQQASPKTHIKYGGSGLGLFISRELTELQGGEIGVKSKPGKGSTFAFYIRTRRAEPPVDADRLAPALTAKESKRRSAEVRKGAKVAMGAVTAKTLPKTGLYVLLVEDNIVNQNVLAKQLRKSGCIVYVANHGVEALDLIQKSTHWADCHDADAPTLDVILMDVEMPVMDGLTCTRRIRQLELEGSVKGHLTIIAITANARKEQMDHTLEAGADSVQPKPFKVAELLTKVQQLRSTDTTYKGRKVEQ